MDAMIFGKKIVPVAWAGSPPAIDDIVSLTLTDRIGAAMAVVAMSAVDAGRRQQIGQGAGGQGGPDEHRTP
jgi:hypothetical protein